jgi:Fur family transcriptional regulator, peroxide stress response regulator
MKTEQEKLDRQLEHFRTRCAETGLRVTPQRLEVYRELLRAADHPSVDMLHRRVRRRLPTITPDTIYRTLNTLEKAGLAVRVSAVGNSARFEAGLVRHHHFVCRACGGIYDVYSKRLDRIHAGKDLPAEYRVDTVQVEFRGICPSCAEPHPEC